MKDYGFGMGINIKRVDAETHARLETLRTATRAANTVRDAAKATYEAAKRAASEAYLLQLQAECALFGHPYPPAEEHYCSRCGVDFSVIPRTPEIKPI